MYKIAICDDDKRYRKTIREIIEHKNSLPENEIRFYEYESGNELLKHTDILHELVFIDIRMPGLDGNQTALKLRNYNKDAVLIFCSSYFEPTVDSIKEGLEKGVLRLKCGIELNVSRAKKEEFTEALFEYLRERNG